MDPHAENYYNHSPYAYVGNNLIKRTDPDGKDWWDKLKGVLVAVGDNASFGLLDLRTELGKSVIDAKDYDMGQNVGDVLSIISGSAEVSGGIGSVIAGSAVTVGSGGQLLQYLFP